MSYMLSKHTLFTCMLTLLVYVCFGCYLSQVKSLVVIFNMMIFSSFCDYYYYYFWTLDFRRSIGTINFQPVQLYLFSVAVMCGTQKLVLHLLPKKRREKKITKQSFAKSIEICCMTDYFTDLHLNLASCYHLNCSHFGT